MNMESNTNKITNNLNKHSVESDKNKTLDHISKYYHNGIFKIPIYEKVDWNMMIHNISINKQYFTITFKPDYEIMLATSGLFENPKEQIKEEVFDCINSVPDTLNSILDCIFKYSKEIEDILQYFKENET